jgi:hypothetical protein
MTKQAAKIHIFMAQKTFLYFIIYQQFTNNNASFSRKLMRKTKRKSFPIEKSCIFAVRKKRELVSN